MNTMTLTPGQLSLSQLYDVWRHPVQLRLDASAIDGINASVACVNDIVAEGRTAY
ncbi:histidine ammonia-lyase, partial [Salmonella enterica]|nr:histidine ammonia-lyase [Salmonella enterica]EAY1478073.1 histidine ammonia-lyase [Salmonella enterica]EAZ3210973.1 histidine ammonia-lyase [Salmonella enterica]EAZ3252166.1 histidine ammonia-lyase [Salmonella enterica]EBQ8299349.1 histidine ammonia-lyase [Salmonella enterica]